MSLHRAATSAVTITKSPGWALTISENRGLTASSNCRPDGGQLQTSHASEAGAENTVRTRSSVVVAGAGSNVAYAFLRARTPQRKRQPP
jgi:hypothetical protein